MKHWSFCIFCQVYLLLWVHALNEDIGCRLHKLWACQPEGSLPEDLSLHPPGLRDLGRVFDCMSVQRVTSGTLYTDALLDPCEKLQPTCLPALAVEAYSRRSTLPLEKFSCQCQKRSASPWGSQNRLVSGDAGMPFFIGFKWQHLDAKCQ